MMYRCKMNALFSFTGGRQVIRVLDINSETHCIAFIESKMNGKNIIMMKLLGKTPTVEPEALKTFRKFVQSKNHDVEDIIIPETDEDCVPGRL
ncbi:lipocalin-1-like isoform X2 [Macrotis lagotis]|uniref:lipocalin-1-like isoform X2 n=1 Tax=Macrotis lagotis TaxID=92651 RepID=UPI003D6908D5